MIVSVVVLVSVFVVVMMVNVILSGRATTELRHTLIDVLHREQLSLDNQRFQDSQPTLVINIFSCFFVGGIILFTDGLDEPSLKVLPSEHARIRERGSHAEGPTFPWLREDQLAVGAR